MYAIRSYYDGDNTLGMSLALIPIYYLIIKLLNEGEFKARWNILWIIPTVFYFGSVLYRIFIGHLSYNQEWFLQYLTLLYVPLLYRWYKDSNISNVAKKALLVSILAFLFVDVEGNILFIVITSYSIHYTKLYETAVIGNFRPTASGPHSCIYVKKPWMECKSA